MKLQLLILALLVIVGESLSAQVTGFVLPASHMAIWPDTEIQTVPGGWKPDSSKITMYEPPLITITGGGTAAEYFESGEHVSTEKIDGYSRHMFYCRRVSTGEIGRFAVDFGEDGKSPVHFIHFWFDNTHYCYKIKHDE